MRHRSALRRVVVLVSVVVLNGALPAAWSSRDVRMRPMANVTQHECACPAACGTDGATTSSLINVHASFDHRVQNKDEDECMEAVPACRFRVPRLNASHDGRPFSLAVLEKNSVYRLKDIVLHRGARFARDAAAVLCDPRYRGTLLRAALAETTRSADFETFRNRTLKDVSSGNDAKLEAIVADHADGPSRGQFSATQRRVQLGATHEILEALARELAERRENANDDCGEDVARDDEVVVIARLGDYMHTGGEPMLRRFIQTELVPPTSSSLDSTPAPAASSSSSSSLFEGKKPAAKMRESETKEEDDDDSKAEYRGAVVSAVLHYGAQRMYRRTHTADARSLARLKFLVKLIEDVAKLPTRVRSEPAVDRDLCYYVFSKHVVGIKGDGRGLVTFVETLRRLVASAAANVSATSRAAADTTGENDLVTFRQTRR